MTQSQPAPAVPATVTAPVAPVADPKKVATSHVYLRVRRSGATTEVTVRVSEEWRKLTIARKTRRVQFRLAGTSDQTLNVEPPGDCTYGEGEVVRVLPFATSLVIGGRSVDIVPGTDYTVALPRPVPRRELEEAVQNVRDKTAETIDQYLRAVELTVAVSATTGGMTVQ